MRRRDYYWSLYHTNEKNQIDNLRTDQVEVVYAAIPKSTLTEWWIWREGFADWKPFADFPSLLLSLRQTEDRETDTPKPPSRPSYVESQGYKRENVVISGDAENVGITNLSLMAEAVGEDRSNMRFKREFDVYVLLADGKKTILGRTVDISLKGMSMKANLPSGLPPFFSVEIRRNKEIIPLVCSEIKTSDGKPSNKLRIEANEYLPALLTLILQTPESSDSPKKV